MGNKILKFDTKTTNRAGSSIHDNSLDCSKGGGGGSMNNHYITREEFNDSMHQIDKHFNLVDTRFDVIYEKFNTLNTKIDTLTKLTWWIMGLIGMGLIIPLLTLVIHTIIK
jgi:archaellum component FlaC